MGSREEERLHPVKRKKMIKKALNIVNGIDILMFALYIMRNIYGKEHMCRENL